MTQTHNSTNKEKLIVDLVIFVVTLIAFIVVFNVGLDGYWEIGLAVGVVILGFVSVGCFHLIDYNRKSIKQFRDNLFPIIEQKLSLEIEEACNLTKGLDKRISHLQKQIETIVTLIPEAKISEMNPLAAEALMIYRTQVHSHIEELLITQSTTLSEDEFYLMLRYLTRALTNPLTQHMVAVSRRNISSLGLSPGTSAYTYIQENVEAIKRGITIRRVFVAKRISLRSADVRRVIDQHIENLVPDANVGQYFFDPPGVRIIEIEHATKSGIAEKKIHPGDLEEDFALFVTQEEGKEASGVVIEQKGPIEKGEYNMYVANKEILERNGIFIRLWEYGTKPDNYFK